MADGKARLPPRWFIKTAWHVHRWIVRATGGRRGLWAPRPGKWGALRLTTTGRRSGEPRSVIVGYYEDGPNLVSMAMNGWGAAEPAWWLNLQADPQAVVELAGGVRREVLAGRAVGGERDRLWQRWRELDENLDSYAARRPCETAVVVLEPRAAGRLIADGKRMRAVVHDRYGPPSVLRLEDVERPEPEKDEVLVRVRATTVTRTDCGWRAAKPFFVRYFTGLHRPRQRILGMELAGEVEAVGAAVSEFKVGDQVFGVTGFGANAEFVCVRESAALAPRPATMSFEEAAAVCDGACIALAAILRADLRSGRTILVYGASGSIGTAAVQLAKHYEAEVTAVCNTKNVELVRSLGADRVIDYLQEDFTKNGERYDVIFDAVGKHSFRRCRGSLRAGGIYLETDLGFLWHVPPLALATRWIGDKRVALPIPKYTKENVRLLKELIEAGKYRAVIDRAYPLEHVVEATTYVETGQKTGNVVLTVNGEHTDSAQPS